MSKVEEITQSAMALPENDRLALAGKLLFSCPDTGASREEIDEAWNVEIKKRIEQVRSGEVSGIAANEVFDSLDEEFGWKS